MNISILHISDLHRDPDNPIRNDVLLTSLESDRRHYASYESPAIRKPDIIVVSGDVVQGVKADLPNAEDVLRRISGLGAATFMALAVFQLIKPGVLTDIPVAMNLFADGMGALMCYVGWRGQKIRSRLEIDKDIAELKGRRDRLQDWINR